MKTPCISIIIPTFNSKHYLPFALKSIFAQTNKSFEVLIIDGGSADDTVSYIEQQQKEYPNIVFISEKDNGIYDAMNKGIKLAKGNWLYFMGSDDTLYNENVLSEVYSYLKSSNYKVIYGNVFIKGDCGWAHDGQLYDGEFNIAKLFKQNICHQAIFYERSIFEQAGNYNTLYKVCADYDFNLKIASRFGLQFINVTIANFNAGGLSTQYPNDQFNLDFNLNILKYYRKKIFSSYMSPYFASMIQYSKKKITDRDYMEGLYFLFAGYYHKIKTKLND